MRILPGSTLFRVALPCLLFALALPCAARERPNIILVMADDQGWGDMAYNGHPHLRTPSFDAAAAAGLRFDRFYAAAPVCSPTRGSVLTGRHPNRYGVFRWGYPIRPQEITLAEALRNAGYATGHFGKWHLGSVRKKSPVHPGASGFDEWLSAPNFFDNDPVLSRRGTAVQMTGESSMVTVEAALEWIRVQAREKRPFLAVVWFGSPHGPHRAVAADRAHYADQPERLQHFLGEITGMDRAFGLLRAALAPLGIRDNTVLWYCSDNGALRGVGSSGGRRGHKGTVYDGGLLVPAFLEWPARIAKPRSTSVRCNTSDIYPTVLEIAGVEVADQPPLDGVSLAPLIDGTADSRPRPMGFWDYPSRGISTPSAKWMGDLLAAQRAGGDLEPHETSSNAARLPDPAYPLDRFPGHAAWIDGDWKLHRIEREKRVEGGSDGKARRKTDGKTEGKKRRKNARRAGRGGNADREVIWELYDLAADPTESEDLAATQRDRVGAMRADLERWLESVVRSLNGEDYRQAPSADVSSSGDASSSEPPLPESWLGPQEWRRDTDGPVLSLGAPGGFDETHIFAPAVMRDGDRFSMWYCGSSGTVAERVFRLGLATSADGRRFQRHPGGAIFSFGDGRRSVLTPTVLRATDGTPTREHGRLRMWFSSTWFAGGGGEHTLHETSSEDGVRWEEPSTALLRGAYAPTVLATDGGYRMWYTDVERDPWVIRHASSPDGRRWDVTATPVLVIDQEWERDRLFYPAVLEVDGVFLMWYGSYWSARPRTTAIGFAVSRDGIRWRKHPGNPVLRPDPDRSWESHYVTSHSVIRLPGGGFRIWYASRKAPPFLNKYFAITTARWDGPRPRAVRR